MSYSIKEVFYSLQGEGFHSGRPALFCRFSKCNLWTGREADRENAVCSFCDTDFIGTDGQNGGRFEDAEALCRHLIELWPDDNRTHPFVVLTGGEPLLQLDQTLVDTLHEFGFEVAVETNGTKRPPEGIDWICVSPKAGAPLILDHGHELKLVYPQAGLHPDLVDNLAFDYFYLQPMEDSNPEISRQNTRRAVEFCLMHPQWRLSLQTHKLLGID